MPQPLNEALRKKLHSLPFEALPEWWQAVEHDHGDDGRRWLGRNDRYYLLIILLDAVYMWHPWIYARCREVEAEPDDCLDLWAREHGKALALDTPVPTPGGWKRHGDLKVGDKVFSPSGDIRTVVAVTDVFHDTECYEISFDGAEPIVCSGNHLWRVGRKSRRRISGTKNGRIRRDYEVIATAQLDSHTHAEDDRYSIDVAAPFDCDDVALPVHPYVLGAWLGDGHSASARITCAYKDIGIIERIRSFGYAANETKSSNVNTGLFSINPGIKNKKRTGLTFTLRSMGVINNKHIPPAYLRASKGQRLELLRGLMDTDGAINTRGTAVFLNTNSELAAGVYELACSLGLKPSFHETVAKLNGVVISPSYRVQFQAGTDLLPFALERKASRCRARTSRANSHFIRGIKRVDNVPTSCIQVDHPDGMYVVGKSWVPTHNSTVITYAGAIQEILVDPEITVCIFSHTRANALKFMRQIKQELQDNKELQRLYPEVLWDDPQKQAPKWSEEAGLVVKRNSNPKEPTLAACGLVDGMPTGAHFRLRIYDDTVTRESVSTPEQIQKTTAAWSLSDNLGAVTKLPDGREVMRRWHIGTRYSYADTYQHILDNQILKPRIYPATDDGTVTGKPVYLSEEIWQHKLKTQLSSDIACQMMQNPLAGNQAMFKKDYLHFAEIRPATLNIYILVDPASSRKKGTDSTAIVVVGIDAQRVKYLLDGYHHKMTLAERWNAIKLLRRHWMQQPGIQGVFVGYERYGMRSDLEYFEERMEMDREAFPITELAWPNEGPGSKYDRIQRLEPDFRNGRFYLIAQVAQPTKAQQRLQASGQGFRVLAPVRRPDQDGKIYNLTVNFVQQFLQYPFVAHDDLIDAVSRIYDMDPRPPILLDDKMLEPEVYADGM